ncbi:glycosyltransferase family 2 protein [Candidatus Chloroploca sp. Khr17]|uniref:glycosyltransferase family 2 protein n=1 Tax=Candidatus Chloroploca sp. Khr17 TaxID=2496869 RepID=UPI00101DD2D8|nr:glycosyltransferase family 2 protein [Candidatus Chloroploca sp. Khr17]
MLTLSSSSASTSSTDAVTQVSVVICTRNRASDLLRATESVLASTHTNFELLVIDQSDSDASEHIMQPLSHDSRLRYVRTAGVGVGLARNIGINAAQAEYLVMTDDDCVVSPTWVNDMVQALEAHPESAMVFCDVVAAPHDSALGWITVSLADRNRTIKSIRDWCAAGGGNTGIGAGVAMRRSMMLAIGGIDEHLGSGSMFRSAWETDAALRSLLRGFTIYRTKDISVEHYGFRSHTDGRTLMKRYIFGMAAIYAKLLKCGHPAMLLVCGCELWRVIIGPTLSSLRRFQRPPVFNRAIAFAQGFLKGLKTPVDRKTCTFRPQ